MEESEKRRERLKAMRTEAAEAGVNTGSEISGSASHCLTNPLIEDKTAAAPSSQYTSPRFDYYTDPMAAFSSNKRRNNSSPQVSQGYYHIPPNVTPPTYRSPAANSPGQRTFHAPRAPYNQFGSPIETASPLGTPQANPPNAWRGPSVANSHNYSPNISQGNDYGSGPGVATNYKYSSNFSQGNDYGSPMVAARGTPQANPPNAWRGPSVANSHNYSPNLSRGNDYGSGPGVATNYNYSPNFSQGNDYGSPGFGRGGSPYVGRGRGRGRMYHTNLQYDSGRGGGGYFDSGRGRGHSQSPGPGPSGRRGGGSHDSVSAELRPDLYYRKEMVEDPWKLLRPVIWKGLVSRDAEKSWLPKSIQKKARVSSEASQRSISQPSLAEFLAASLNDSANEAAHDDPGSKCRKGSECEDYNGSI